jgi:hypothetical protein
MFDSLIDGLKSMIEEAIVTKNDAMRAYYNQMWSDYEGMRDYQRFMPPNFASSASSRIPAAQRVYKQRRPERAGRSWVG